MNIKKHLLFKLNYNKKKESWIFLDGNDNPIIQDKPYGSLLFDFLDLDVDKLRGLIKQLTPYLNYSDYRDFEKVKESFFSIIEKIPEILTDIKYKIYSSISVTNNLSDSIESLNNIINVHESIRLLIDTEDSLGEKIYNIGTENLEEHIISLLQNADATSRLMGHNQLLKYELVTKLIILHLNGKLKFLYFYPTDDFSSLFTIYFIDFINHKVMITKCKNCGKLFIARAHEVYCDRVFDNNGNTCKQVGASITYSKTLKDNKVISQYRRAYAKYYARYKKGILTKQELEDWRKKAKCNLQLTQSGKMSESDFFEWLKS